MRRHDRWSPIGTGAALVLTLLVLGSGLCLFDHDGDGIDDHGMPQDFCWVMLVVPGVTLTVLGLAPQGLVVCVGGAGFTTVPRSLLDPPPRPYPSV